MIDHHNEMILMKVGLHHDDLKSILYSSGSQPMGRDPKLGRLFIITLVCLFFCKYLQRAKLVESNCSN